MTQKLVLDALVQVKRMGNLLSEVQDISRQIAEALDRNDQVSTEMLVHMRQEPIDKLLKVEQTLRDLTADGPEGLELAEHLNGHVTAREGFEGQLSSFVAQNRRRLEQVRELDRILNRRMAGEKTVYS